MDQSYQNTKARSIEPGGVPVSFVDGVACALWESGPEPLLIHGYQQTEANPDWSFTRLYGGPAGLCFVELRSASEQAVHYYDHELNYLANAFAALDPDARDALAAAYVPVLRDFWASVVCGLGDPAPETLRALAGLGPACRLALGEALRHQVLPPDDVRILGGDLPPPLSPDGLRRLFAADLLAAQIGKAADGAFRLPSPFAGPDNLSNSGCLIRHNDYYLFYAYRFRNVAAGLAYDVLCGGWHARIIAVSLPSLNLTLFPNEETRDFFLRSAHLPVREATYAHAVEHAPALAAYLPAGGPGRVALACFSHLGHHLWNELTGLQALTASLPAASLPPVAVVGSGSSEMYGKLEALFPGLKGRIDRTVAARPDLAAWLYDQQALLLRPTAERIDDALARRIIAVASATRAARAVQARLAALKRDGHRVVVLGLRVENRTLTDVPGFCRAVIGMLRAELGRVAVVLDGHNRPEDARADAPGYPSLHQPAHGPSPLAVEQEIVRALIRAFHGRGGVAVVPTVGLPVAASLAACAEAEFFVAPWGAGLAKYKWVCNLPGLFVSSRSFLKNAESWLYDDPAHRERPALSFRIAPHEAEDQPDAPQLIPGDGPSRWNFTVDLAAVRRELRALVAYLGRCGGPTPDSFRVVPPTASLLPPRPELGQAWRMAQATVGHGFRIVELRHDGGEDAEWFFNAEGGPRSHVLDWPPETYRAFRRAVLPAVRALRDTLLPGGTPPPPEALRDLLRLGPRLRALAVDAAQEEVLPEPAHLALGAGDEPPAWADPAALSQALSADLQERFLAGLRTGALTWPSPVTGAAMLCTGGFSLDDFNALYRFRDASTGLDLFVLATEHLARVAGLYVPAHGVVVTAGLDQPRILRQHFHRLAHRLLRHLAEMGDSLLAGRRMGGGVRLAAFLRGGGSAHLGHQLWNELTAIDALCAALPPARLPTWLVPGGDVEFYGPIDALYPEIAGRVRRGFAGHAALTRHAYETGAVLFRPTRDHVGAALRRRVMARAVARAPALPGPGRAFILGLRVENRTATDLEALCALVIEEAERRHPGCAVILDGHNARGDRAGDATIGSYREEVASQTPLSVERALAEALRTRFAGRDVRLLDTLGEPLATSLAWADASDGFVALWGAGLAKYRWLANKPGLVVTNRWNLEQKGDLHLYDAPAFMADPAPMAFIPSDAVQDEPFAPMLVPFDASTYANFSFDEDALRRHVAAFLEGVAARP